MENGYLGHVFDLLERAGYVRDSLSSDWNLLWSHEYPFRVLRDRLTKLGKHQKVSLGPFRLFSVHQKKRNFYV